MSYGDSLNLDELRPVFIGGLYRSGTGLMQAILGNHPNIAMAPYDRVWWTQVYPRYRRSGLSCNWSSFLDELFGLYQTRNLGLELKSIRDRANSVEEGDFASVFSLILTAYADEAGKPRWGEKTPMLHRYAAEILSVYPRACFIHMLRDPRDTFASMYHAHFYIAPLNWLVASAGWVALDWIEGVKLAAHFQSQFPDRYLVVRYEELVGNAPVVMRRVCDFLQEPYYPSMLDVSRYPSRIPQSNSSFDNLEGISTIPVQRFREVLSPAQVWIVEQLAGQRMTDAGYEHSKRALGTLNWLRLAAYEIPAAMLHIAIRLGVRTLQKAVPCLAGARPSRTRPVAPHRVRLEEATRSQARTREL